MSNQINPEERSQNIVPATQGQLGTRAVGADDDIPKQPPSIPPEAIKVLMELTEMRASFGPDPETAKILAETERHAEDKKLEGYMATLEHRDRENERKHVRIVKRIGTEAHRGWAVLIASIIGAIAGIYLYLTGKQTIGVSLLIFAGIMIKDLAGKSVNSVDSE